MGQTSASAHQMAGWAWQAGLPRCPAPPWGHKLQPTSTYHLMPLGPFGAFFHHPIPHLPSFPSTEPPHTHPHPTQPHHLCHTMHHTSLLTTSKCLGTMVIPAVLRLLLCHPTIPRSHMVQPMHIKCTLVELPHSLTPCHPNEKVSTMVCLACCHINTQGQGVIACAKLGQAHMPQLASTLHFSIPHHAPSTHDLTLTIKTTHPSLPHHCKLSHHIPHHFHLIPHTALGPFNAHTTLVAWCKAIVQASSSPPLTAPAPLPHMVTTTHHGRHTTHQPPPHAQHYPYKWPFLPQCNHRCTLPLLPTMPQKTILCPHCPFLSSKHTMLWLQCTYHNTLPYSAPSQAQVMPHCHTLSHTTRALSQDSTAQHKGCVSC